MKKVVPLVIGCLLCVVGLGLIVYGGLRLEHAASQQQDIDSKQAHLDTALANIDKTRADTIQELTSAEYASAAHTATKFQEFSAYPVSGSQDHPIFGVNARGQAFGDAGYTSKYLGVIPELSEAMTTDGKAGYVYSSAYMAEAMGSSRPANQEQSSLSVYDQDGTTVIGQLDRNNNTPNIPTFNFSQLSRNITITPFVAKTPDGSIFFGVNKYNETYGTDLAGLVIFRGDIDLVEVTYDDNGKTIHGYYRPTEATKQVEGYTKPVQPIYESDGKTIVGYM